MAARSDERLGVGIIGLGRLWEARHKPALLRRTDRFRIVAVYDQVARRANTEANALRCEAVEGLNALVQRPDIDAVYVLGPQWFGLHPVSIAAEAGKAIYCAVAFAGDPRGAERAAAAVHASGVPFMPELARRFYPATLRLRELIATALGPVRLVVGHARLAAFDRYDSPGPATQTTPAPLAVDPGGNLLDWCRFIFQADPAAVGGQGARLVSGSADDDYDAFALDFSDGRMAQVSLSRHHRTLWGEAERYLPAPGFQVFAERGAAWLEMPDRIRWSDAKGVHDEHLPAEPTVGDVMNDHFHRLVLGRESLAPGLDDALATARLVDDWRRARIEERVVRPAGKSP